MDIFGFLNEKGIIFRRFDHPAVFTCEESDALKLSMPGHDTKNLFLRDKKGKRHFLVSVGHEKQVDLKALTEALDVQQGLSFASPERLKEYLGVEPGSVTMLGLVNDREKHAVEFVIDQVLWDADAVCAHPLVNTATLVITHDGLVKFLAATGHQERVIDVPQKGS